MSATVIVELTAEQRRDLAILVGAEIGLNAGRPQAQERWRAVLRQLQAPLTAVRAGMRELDELERSR